jgi:hypothetical protein
MLLIFAPVAKPCGPPAGVAKLSGALQAHGISCTVLDANLEGLLYLLRQPNAASDTWTRRAIKNISSNLQALRNPQIYRYSDRYRRAVADVNHVLEKSAGEFHVIPGLADYHHQQLSPVRSADLIFAAEHPEQNPFYPYFKLRLPEILIKTGSLPPIAAFGGRLRREGMQEAGYGDRAATPFIGFSLNYLSQALCTFAMIGHIKKNYPDYKIILGGGLVTSWMKGPAWKNPFGGLVDHVIMGPGEQPLLELLGVRELDRRHVMPDYSALPLHEYLSPGVVLPYSGSSGCFFRKCSFCPETAEDNPYVPVPAKQAMADLASLITKTGPVLVHLLDNSISPALMRALASGPLEVPWYGFARIGTELTDLDYCMQLKRSGCRMLMLGLESGDQGVLDRMQKGIDLATASLALNNLHAAGIATYVYLLFGTPAETVEAARRTLEFVVQHRFAITFLNLAIFNMPVCSQETGEYKIEQFYEGDLSLYTGFKHPHGWDRKLVRQFLDNEFRKNDAISMILRNDPPIFSSNHAFFMLQP